MTHRGPARASARIPAPHRRVLVAVALVGLIGTGCASGATQTGTGGGSNPAATDGPTGVGGDQSPDAAAAPDPAELRELQERLPAYAECMRENGVPDFPDPGPDGTIQYQGDSDRPEFASAGEKCDDLLPPPAGLKR